MPDSLPLDQTDIDDELERVLGDPQNQGLRVAREAIEVRQSDILQVTITNRVGEATKGMGD